MTRMHIPYMRKYVCIRRYNYLFSYVEIDEGNMIIEYCFIM